MPLFTFKCSKCSKIIEKFVKNEEASVQCDCGCTDLVRQFGQLSTQKVWRGSQDHMENVINPEIERIQQELSNGNDSVFLDIAGDD